jgi:hypothetical protein
MCYPSSGVGKIRPDCTFKLVPAYVLKLKENSLELCASCVQLRRKYDPICRKSRIALTKERF